MKIVYKKTISDRILDATVEAQRTGREIEHVEITYAEYREIARLEGGVNYIYTSGVAIPTLHGVNLVIKGD